MVPCKETGLDEAAQSWEGPLLAPSQGNIAENQRDTSEADIHTPM